MRTEYQITDFIRPLLEETFNGDVDPEPYIQEWLDVLRTLKEPTEGEDGSPLSEPKDIHLLLALYGRLRRISEKFHDDDLIQLMDWACRIYHGLKPEDFAGALTCFDPVQWLEEADQLSKAWEEEDIEAEEARHRAVTLFKAYDDINICVELAWEKLNNCRFVNDYHEQLYPCDQWVREDRYLVELASLWYQTYAAMFDEKIEDCSYRSMTLPHFVLQLDKLQDTWEYMNTPLIVSYPGNNYKPKALIDGRPDKIIILPCENLVLAAAGCCDDENSQNDPIEIEISVNNFEFTMLIFPSREHQNICFLRMEGKSDELIGCKIQFTLNDQPFESMNSFEKDGDRYVCEGYIGLNFLTLVGDIESIKESIEKSKIKVYHE